jgi:LPS-assembly lipoprotein
MLRGRFLRTGLRLVVPALALVLAGCLRPMYGPTSTGERLQDVLAAVEVARIDTSFVLEPAADELRNELIFKLDGSGQPVPKRYRLSVTLDGELIRTGALVLGRGLAAMQRGRAAYVLIRIDGETVVARGNVEASAQFEQTQQRFAGERAGREALLRVGRQLADEIRNDLGAKLALGRGVATAR